ncbi:hypothetical protein F5Y03DRAFT_376362 [Xylaria venustula]|nr:hypothetical protein F5Y03DRAFT_376362 [Xylaria venustula]
MSSDNPSSYPSLTSSWTPASSCVRSTGFWYVVYATNAFFSDMFGMPSVTDIGQESTPEGGCVPPSYTLSIPYLTAGGCPTHYFAACSTETFYADHSADYIWCCPSVEGWNFNCAPATDPGAAPYGCQATFNSGDIITGSRTDLIELTGQAETHTVQGDNGVNAWGIAILSTSAPSTSTVETMSTAAPSRSTIGISAAISTGTSTSNPSSTTSSSAQGFSTGAAAGIGVGVGGAALAIIGLLIFWLLRRKYKTIQEQEQHQRQQHQQEQEQQYHQPPHQSYQNSFHTISEIGQTGSRFFPPTVVKHNSTPPVTELGTPTDLSPDGHHNTPQELQG